MMAMAEAAGARAAAETRDALLKAAAAEMHLHGYQAASLARILAQTGVTKGALYHHFSSKLALGYAVLDEQYAPVLRRYWIDPLNDQDADPVQTLIDVILKVGQGMTEADVLLGCPVNNLAQEMAPVDEGFRKRIEALFDEWRSAIELALRRAQQQGDLAMNTDVVSAAAFIVASLEGCVGMAKNAQSRDVLLRCGGGLIDYLRSLRDQASNKRRKKHD